MEQLLAQFQPGVVPHPLILQALADLSLANPFAIVPFLKALLGMMLPILSSARHEQARWAIAYALGRFSQAIIDYLMNIEKAPDPSMKKSIFESEVAIALDFLLANWLQARETKVRAETVVSLGYMSQLLSMEKLEEQLPKLIMPMVNLYKRHQDCYPVTKGLCLMIESAVEHKCMSLENCLENIITAVFMQVCSPPDYSEPMVVRNHNESLRCFTLLVPMFPDKVVTFLMMRVASSSEKIRVGALTALKHIINSADANLADKMRSITLGLRVVLHDHSNKVKKVLAQVIVALAHHGYLETDGGHNMIEFLIRQCALLDDETTRPADYDYVSNEALRTMCENVLQLLTTTVDNIEKVLWPSLFEYLLAEDLTVAVGTICKCLANFASRKQKDHSVVLEVDYQKYPGVPKPQALLARLFVMLGDPLAHHCRGVHILRLLRAIPSVIHKDITALWDTVLPQMILTLDGCLEQPESLDRDRWCEDLVQLCQRCFLEVDKEDWTLSVGASLQSQLPLYNGYPGDKCMLLRLLGVVMKKVTSKTFINQTLDKIFEHVNHANLEERKGCALAVGYCGASHLDAVLVKLEQVAKADRRGSGLLSFIKDLTGSDYHEKLLATVILCYGHVSVQAPASILVTRIETPILRSSAKFYQSSKELCVRQAMLQTVRMVADAVHSLRLQEPFTFQSRGELLQQMEGILKGEHPSVILTRTRALVLQALASLVKLDPALPETSRASLVEVAAAYVYPLSPKAPSQAYIESYTEETIEDHAQLVLLSIAALDQFLVELLSKERTPENFRVILKVLHPWLTSKKEYERERCLNSIWQLMSFYSDNLQAGVFQVFSCFGYILGLLTPRCADPSISIRNTALKCIQFALEINNKSQSLSSSNDADIQYIEGLQLLTQDPDSTTLVSVTQELAQVIVQKVPPIQLLSLIDNLLDGLMDPHPQSSVGASAVLAGVIQLRGGELRAEVSHLVESLRKQLTNIQCVETRSGTLQIISNLARHHLTLVVNALLASPLPFDEQVRACYKALVKDVDSGRSILSYLLDIINDGKAYEMHPDPKNYKSTIKIATTDVLGAICCLEEVLHAPEMETCSKEEFGPIFSALLLTTAAYLGVHPPSASRSDVKGAIGDHSMKLVPLQCTIRAFESFLLCAKQEQLFITMCEQQHWANFEDEKSFPVSVAMLGRLLSVHCPKYIKSIIGCLRGALGSTCEHQRAAVVAIFAEFLTQTYPDSHPLVEPLMGDILGKLSDPCPAVRRLCIKGLANIDRMDIDVIHRYSSTVLSAMITGLDDKDDAQQDITLEAVNGLATVLMQAEVHNIGNIIITVSLRLRPMFEKERGEVRAAAFKLFGDLAKFGEGDVKEAFVEQALNSLVTVLVHLNEDDKNVVRACKQSLKKLGPLLGSDGANNMFQKHLPEDSILHYGEFINDLSKVLVVDLEEYVSNFVTSGLSHLRGPHPSIQCNAAVLLGCLLGNLKPSCCDKAASESVCSALLVLLKSDTPELRSKAAEALGALHAY
uniref:Putative heat repeat-containing protein 7a n=2 Tax=Ornithodoros turicata TaxID=34597 RepID=A0A2R5LMZ7_9ACAR